MEKHELIKHLSDEQEKELRERYYKGEKSKDLIDEFNICFGNKISFPKILTPIECEYICEYCNINMFKIFKARYGRDEQYIIKCYKCNHTTNGVNDKIDDSYLGYGRYPKTMKRNNCNCENCNKKMNELFNKMNEFDKKIRELKQRLKIKWFNKLLDYENSCEFKPKIFEQLSSKEKILLGAVIYNCISEDFTEILPLFECLDESFNYDLSNDIYDILLNCKLIKPNKNNDAIYYRVFPKTNHIDFNNLYAKFDLNLKSEILSYSDIIKFLFRGDILINNYEAVALWCEHVNLICIEYLKYTCLKVFNKHFEPSEKSKTYIFQLLMNFSAAQICSMIYNSTNQILRLQKEKYINDKHACNLILKFTIKYGENAIKNNWNINNSYLEKKLKIPFISNYFFERVLNIGDDFFYKKPCLENLPDNKNIILESLN